MCKNRSIQISGEMWGDMDVYERARDACGWDHVYVNMDIETYSGSKECISIRKYRYI